ncbi:MAG: FHA domain-containing protein, partial [Chloroflexota bacterium]
TLTDTRMPRLAVHTPGKTWEVPLAQDALTIGRQSDRDIFLDDQKVSRCHACIERRGEAFVIHDLGSTNGTWLGDQRVEEYPLQDGDTIRIGDARLLFKRGFAPDDLTLIETEMPARKLARRPVIIVPGFMGSELWHGEEQLWPNVRYLFAHPEIFRLPEVKPLEARGLVGEVVIVPNLIKLEQYNRLGDYLEDSLGYERGKDLLEFAYDWRQDVRLSARRLAEAIDRWSVTPPITIVAHSLGCLVSRYYVERLGGKNKVERLILLGGPHSGVPKALTSLLLGPKLLPFGILGDRLRQVLATFPSMYQILPTYACAVDQQGQPIDVLSDETWLSETQRPLLAAAREFRRELGTHSAVPTVSIFGYGSKTVTGATVQRDAQGRWQKVDLAIEPSGDATIPEQSAVMKGSEIHPVQQVHGVLYVDSDVKMRLRLELTR